MAEDAVVDILPGGQAGFAIEFQNSNDATYNFSLSISSGAPESDWSYTISPQEVSLELDERGFSWINFTAPNTAEPGTIYMMTVELNTEEVLDNISIVLEVKPIQGARLWPMGEVQASANPGETVFFDVRLVNYESQDLDIDLSLFELKDGWVVEYDNESSWTKSVPAGTTTVISIGVTPPDQAEAVETFWMRVILKATGFEDTYYDANITVGQEYGVSIESIGNTELLGNVSELITVSVTNAGNGPDILDLYYTGEWIDNTTSQLSFDAFETKDLTFPISSGLVAPGSQSSVFLIVN